jgi:hypothetical protein
LQLLLLMPGQPQTATPAAALPTDGTCYS